MGIEGDWKESDEGILAKMYADVGLPSKVDTVGDDVNRICKNTPPYDRPDWGKLEEKEKLLNWMIWEVIENISEILERNGFEVMAVKYQTGHSFWLFSLHHFIRFNRILPSKMISRLFHPLESFPALVIITGFDFIRAKLGFRTSAMLLVARKKQD